MPLDKSTVAIALSQGLDTKTDPKQVVSGKLLQLQNATFQTPQEIKKRNGYNQIGNSISAGNGIVSYNQELIVEDGQSVFSYSQDQNIFNSKGNKLAVDFTAQSIVKNTFQQTVPDSAYTANLQVFAWEDSQGGVRYCVIDYQTGQLLVPSTVLLSTGIKPKIKIIGNFFVIFYGDSASANLRYVSINTSTPTVLSSPTVVASDFSQTHPNFDATVCSTRLFVAYNNGGGGITLFYLSTVLVQSSTTVLGGDDANQCLTIFADLTLNQIWVAYQDTALAIKYLVRDFSLGLILAVTTIETTSACRNITGAVNNGSGQIFYEVIAATNDNAYIRNAICTNTGTVSGISVLIRSVGLFSKAFFYNGTIYIVITHDSTLQPTYFLYNTALKTVVSKFAPSNGGGLSAKTSDLTEINFVATNLYQFAYLFKDLLVAVEGNVFTQTGINSAIVSFGMPIVNQVLGNDLHMSGGILTMYDGANVVEHGFNLYPENITDSIIPAAATGGLSVGSYQYEVIYEWTDNQGQLHRSAPSIALTNDVQTFTQYNFTASTTSGSSSVNGVPTATTQLAYNGMSISGVGIPANTLIVNISGGSLTLSNNATVTGTGTFTLSPTLEWFGAPFTGSNLIIEATRPTFLPYYGTAVAGSPILTIPDPSRMAVGRTLVQLAGSIDNVITAINGNQVTINANAPTSGNFVFSEVIQFFCTSVSTSPILTNCSGTSVGIDTGFFDSLIVGTPIFIVATDPRSATHTIVSFNKAARTITVSSNWGTTSSLEQVNVSPSLNDFLTVGEVITPVYGATFPTGTKITAIDNLNGVVTVDNPATSVTLDPTFGDAGFNVGPGFSNVLTIPTLRVTDKKSVSIIIYRTEVNGTIFYRITSPQSLLYNDPTVDFVTYLDNAFDANIIGNEQLYTTGGEVDNIAVPATGIAAIYKNRMVAIPEESPISFWYSKQVIPGSPVEFSDVFVENIDSKGGAITALSVMDDKLILFKSNLIFYVAGDGPSPAGTNNTFTDSILIASDTGCVNKKSVVSTPVGIMYQSQNGIYLLDRSLQVSYIGAPVEQFNSATITSALLIPGVTQVRFTLNTGTIIVFDYFMNQWSVFTNNIAADSCIYNQIHTYVSNIGVINQETPGTFTDNGAFIQMNLITSWLSFVGLQGYQRAYKLLLLGQYRSPHTLHVNIAYDFAPTASQLVQIPVATNPSPTPYQYRVFMQIQKCETMQLIIFDTQSMPYGEGFMLSNLAFEVGKKRDLDKLPAAQSYG